MKNKKIFDVLFRLAEDQPKVAAAKVAAVLIYKGDIVSFGFNSYKTHPFHKRFSAKEDKISLHAETSVVCKAVKRISLEKISKSTLFVCRMKFDMKKISIWGLAKPCVGCQRAIAQFNIRKVLYSEEGIGNYSFL